MRRHHHLILLVCLFIHETKLSAQLPAGFSSSVLQNGYTAPMGVVFTNNGSSMWTWEKSGKVYVSKWNGTTYVKQATPVLDINDEVGDWRDFGLLSFCPDPAFETNGLVYLYYVVDRHHLMFAGTPQYNPATNDYFKPSIGRVTRYRLNLNATVTTDYSSRKILIGESITTGIPQVHESHLGGTLIFGRDGTLLLTTGDGASYNAADVGSASDTYYQQALTDGIIRPEENVGAFRSQMVNSLNGKLLRFDPTTGDGIPSNPFYDAANPRAPKSRVWALGFRNPFRMSMQPNTGSTNAADGNPGTFLIGDVGWNTWEEINVVAAAGLNCGWPLFEGQISEPEYAPKTTVNQDEGQQFRNLCSQPTSFVLNSQVTSRRFTHYRPAVAWRHATNETRVPYFNGTTPTDPLIGDVNSPTTGQPFAGNCAIGGVYYTSNAFGPAYQNTYFFGDYGTNIIKVTNLNSAQPWFTNISNFAPANFTNGIVDMEQNPLDNSILYVNINTGEIMKISLAGNQPPVAAISSNKKFGASPLSVDFTSSGSIDPDGGPLQYLWDFGDGTTSTDANPTHIYSGTGMLSFTVTLTVTDQTSLTSSKSLLISLNNTPPTAVISNPVNNSLYSILNATQVQLAANVTDNETTTGMHYAWEVVLRHNNHEHREPAVNDVSPIVQISPVGCDGNTYYYMIQLTVTDNGGLTAMDSVKIYPDCSTAGLGVTNLTATPQNNTVLLSWTNPSATFDEVMVAAKASTGFLSNPSGTNYVASADFNGAGTAFEGGKIVYKGTGQSVTVINLVPGTTYYFRVFTRIGTSWSGGVETPATILSNLTGVGVASSATVNLTTEGTSDWAHWSGYDHKSSGGSKISNYTAIGTGSVLTYNNDPRTLSWSDGTPTASGSNKNGIYITGIGKGFQITAPADLTQRTLKVYVGGWMSGGTLTASLSDGSAPDYANTSFSNAAGQYNAVYTLTYKAASAGKLITVKWVQASGTGNVTLQAATLVQSSGGVVNVTGVTVNPTSASLLVNATQQVTATIAPANATNQNVTWGSSNNAVATVSSTGLVTAVAAGSAVITVTTQDGAKTATCNITVTQPAVPVTGVTLNPTSASLLVSATQQLTATIAPANATNKNVTWSSSNNAAATVNSTGLVTAVAAGSAVITVTTQDGGKTATCNITVTQPTVPVTGVTLNPTSASLVINNTQQLTATIAPANATNKNVTWSSSNNAVATVSSTGLVTAVAAGSAVITVTTQDGGKTATCDVTVTQPPPPGAVLTGSGVSSSATVNLTTQGTSDWAHWSGYAHKSSGGSKISNYTVVGTGTVTNYTNDTRRCTWSDGTPTTSGSNRNGISITGTGKGFQITAPADLTQRTLKVYVGGSASGGTFTASLSDGSAPDYVNSSFSGNNQYDVVYTLTYKATSAGKLITVKWVQASGSGNVRLQAATLVQVVNVTSVTVTPTSASLSVNGTQQLTATIAPSNATNKNVTWSSSNNTVATVSSAGLVTALAAGNAVITVTTQDGAKTATCNINVTQPAPVPVTGVTLNPTSASLVVNNTQQLTATIAPANATNKNVSWSTSSATVATVSSAGLVTALSAGTAVITVTTQDGGKTATCNITVTLPAPGGALTGSGVGSSATVNLTTEGSADWAHWYGYDHKSSGGGKISNFTVVGAGTLLTYTNDPRTLTWSDGTPTASGSNKNGSYIAGIGNGFQITAPADLTQRTLKVYVGGWISGGTLTASLSDGSAPNYTNTSFSNTAGQYNAVYTLTYKAGSAGKLITVKWTQASGTGNVTIQAATLVENAGLVTMARNNVAEAAETQVTANNSLTIFPNPFNDNLVIRYSGKEIGSGVIHLYTSEMRLVATYPFDKTSLNLNKQITPRGLINGLYIVEFNIGQTKIIRQLLRLN